MAKFNVYEEVTNRVINALEQGVIPWRKPWSVDGSAAIVSHTTGGAYSFLNQMFISMSRTLNGGLPAGEYLTFQQAKKEGGQVRKGEKGSLITFYKWQESPLTDEEQELINDGWERVSKGHPVLKTYYVFEVSQCDGIERKHTTDPAAAPAAPSFDYHAAAEQLVSNYAAGSSLRIERDASSTQAFYSLAGDFVRIPAAGQFEASAEYYSTLFHELTHSTGAPSRLARDLSGQFGSKTYAREELTAEIGAAFFLATLGINTDSSDSNNAAYIQNWLTALKGDNNLIFAAASKAQKAVEYIKSFTDSKAN